jgi:hypothetical protein
MDVRIARKVAALSGIAGPPDGSDDAGRGLTWFSDYRALTTTELSLGGTVLASAPPPDEAVVDAGMFRRSGSAFAAVDGPGPTPLSSVTLQDYGPDTKAALVLTGVNVVLRPVVDALLEVLADLRRRIDDECLLVAVTQTLLQEVFEAQPLLFLHGIQASRIQRALSLSDGVQSLIDASTGPVALSRVEHGWQHSRTARRRPDQLGIMWNLWDAVVAVGPADQIKEGAYVAFRPLGGYEQDHGMMVVGGPDARRVWVAILQDLAEAHLIGTSPGLPPSTICIMRRADEAHAVAVFARERQIELMLARLAPRLVAVRDTGDKPREVELPRFQAVRWATADLLTRRAALLTQYYCVRAAGWLAGMKDLNRRRDRAVCAARFAELAAAADELLAVDDPLRIQLGVQGRAYLLQYDACRGRLDHVVYRRIVADLDRLVDFGGAGRYPEAQLVEHLQIVLVELGTYRSAMEWFGNPDATRQAAVTADLRRLWTTARTVRDRLLVDVEGADLSYLDHDYAGFLISDPKRGPDVVDGIRILDQEVIPAREAIARLEGRARGLRLSRQVLLRGLRTAIEARLGPLPTRRAWAARAWDVADDLEADPETDALVAQRASDHPGGFDNSVLILLLRIAEGRVAALASDLVPSPTEAQVGCVDRALERVETYAQGPAASGGDGPVDPMRVLQVRELGERWRARNGRPPAEASRVGSPPTGRPSAPPSTTR